MSEALREATFDEYVANVIIKILALENPFGVKRDLIGQILGISYAHERALVDAKRMAE